MDHEVERRVGIRYSVSSEAKVHILDLDVEAEILDVSSRGCGVACPTTIASPRVRLEFHDGANRTKPQSAIVVHPDNSDSLNGHYGLQFEDPVRLERFGWFGKYLGDPLRDARTLRSHFEAQKTVAMKDLDSIEASIRDLKGRQFQLFAIGLPLFVGLLGSSYALVLDPNPSKPPWWVLFVPFAAMMLSIPMFAVFLQKSASLARLGAFALLLQRYLASGQFPIRYRGWEDAFANLNFAVRFGMRRDSPLRVQRRPIKKSRRRFIPGDAFKILNTVVFLSVPPLAVLAMWLLSRQLELSWTWHTVVVFATTVIVMLAYGWVGAYGWQVSAGNQSFDHMLMRFSKVLEHASMFDPYREDLH